MAVVALWLLAPCGQPQGAEAVSGDLQRGALLYENACGQCHTEQAHWRQKHRVRSWGDLLYQVNRWQTTAGQNWREADVQDVAAYLNERFYHLSCPGASC